MIAFCLLLKISWGIPYLSILDLKKLFVSDAHMKKKKMILPPLRALWKSMKEHLFSGRWNPIWLKLSKYQISSHSFLYITFHYVNIIGLHTLPYTVRPSCPSFLSSCLSFYSAAGAYSGSKKNLGGGKMSRNLTGVLEFRLDPCSTWWKTVYLPLFKFSWKNLSSIYWPITLFPCAMNYTRRSEYLPWYSY